MKTAEIGILVLTHVFVPVMMTPLLEVQLVTDITAQVLLQPRSTIVSNKQMAFHFVTQTLVFKPEVTISGFKQLVSAIIPEISSC